MSEHVATLSWRRDDASFDYQTYPRDHTWSFGHGVSLPASAAPGFLGDEARVDPEQAFVASLSSCHMLTFLAIASRRGFTVDAYDDQAVGQLAKNEAGKLAITHVELRPRVTFSGEKQPDDEALRKLHVKAHKECFLANSVCCEITVTPG